jgi:hypothetical protein
MVVPAVLHLVVEEIAQVLILILRALGGVRENHLRFHIARA